MIGFDFPDGVPVAQGFIKAALGVIPAVDRALSHHAWLLRTRIMAHAQGRPGPRRVTGDYLRTWTVVPLGPLGGHGYFVGSNAPQGPRLEFGFTGRDALDRHYDQPPYPHVGPAVAEAEPEFADAMDVIVQGAMGAVVAS